MNYNAIVEKIERGINQYRKTNGLNPALVLVSNNYLLQIGSCLSLCLGNIYIQGIKVIASNQVEDGCIILLDR